MNSARDFALLLLDEKKLPNWRPGVMQRKYAAEITDPADPRDRALAEQIETGVIQNLLQLQYLIQSYSGRPLPKVHALLQKILAMAIYQIRFLDRVPESAAVDEAVEQAKRFGQAHASGFVNAILRKAARSKEGPLPEFEDPAEEAEVHYSHPRELFERLDSRFGEEAAIEICQHDNIEPPTLLRICEGVTAERIAEFLKRPADALPVREGFLLGADLDRATLAQLSHQGLAQVQDPTSAKVLASNELKAGQKFLDRCCGLGTKTLQARERIGETGRIVAIDPNEARCDGLRRMLAMRKISNVQVIQSEEFPAGLPDIPQRFDVILVDAPCSNSGVLARRPEARYYQDERSLESVTKLQKAILSDTMKCMPPGGELIYSTCSVWPEENEHIVRWLRYEFSGLELVNEESTLPESSEDPLDYHDGGYFARVRRKG